MLHERNLSFIIKLRLETRFFQVKAMQCSFGLEVNLLGIMHIVLVA